MLALDDDLARRCCVAQIDPAVLPAFESLKRNCPQIDPGVLPTFEVLERNSPMGLEQIARQDFQIVWRELMKVVLGDGSNVRMRGGQGTEAIFVMPWLSERLARRWAQRRSSALTFSSS